VRGGVEAAATESRVGFGVVKGPREGVALELDLASGAVKGSTKVIAGDALLRVLPALDGDLPVDAIAETGPLHVVRGSGDDADSYEIGNQAGFLAWRARGHEAWSRLWPMTSDVEAPRIVRSGKDRVLVYRREGAIWLGAVEVDEEGAHPRALLRLSDSAATVQVGTPALDGKGDVGVAAWSQRDTRGGGRWTLRWTHWRQGAKPDVVRELASPGEGGAIAPNVAVLDGGDFLIAWTEGAAGHHRVRAQLFGADDEPIGAPLDASALGVDAGQAQVALGGTRGAIGYLVARAAGFDLVAAPIACE
jgi:hypothetical protein